MRIIVPTVLLLAASLACAEAIEDPSDLFLRAFGAFQKGETLAAGNSPEEAAREFQQAGALLKELEDIHPSWNPAIVEFRQKRVAQALEKLPVGDSTKAETSSGASTDKRSPDSTCCEETPPKSKCLIKPDEAPSDVFLRAFGTFQKGEKLVAGNSPEEAAREFKQSDALLKELREKYPNWNPAIVEFRQKRVAQALEKLPVRDSEKTKYPYVPPTNLRSPDINPFAPESPSKEQWQQFRFNGQPYYVVPLMVPADQFIESK